jgi:outer membrane protein OmpA-like peptidoglycan-associated protein
MQQNVSRVEERAMTAENKATEAGRAAQQAQSTANEGVQLAKNATEIANESQGGVKELRQTIGNLNNYRMVSSEEVMFRFDQAQLTDETRQKLDQIAEAAKGQNGSIIEVQGFTDRTGPVDYNLALSRRRADAVVRYLVQKEVPLRRIHMIGLGEWSQEFGSSLQQASTTGAAATGTEAEAGGQARVPAKEMRKVVLRVWAPDTTMAASAGQGQSQMENRPQPPTPRQNGSQPEQSPQSPARP